MLLLLCSYIIGREIFAHFCDRTGPDFMQPTYTLGRVLCFASLLDSIPAVRNEILEN